MVKGILTCVVSGRKYATISIIGEINGHRHLSLKMQNVEFISMSDFLQYCTPGQNVQGNLT